MPSPIKPLTWIMAWLASASLACSLAGAVSQPPTSSPVPPTDTAAPSATSAPTATHDLEATRAVQATDQAAKALAGIQTQLADLKLPTEGSLGWAQTESASVKLNSPNQFKYSPFAADLSATDFIIKTDITWETSGLPTCGFYFRSEQNFDKGRQYLFQILRLSGAPGWDIEFLKDGFFMNSPTKTHFSSALDLDNGATNRIVLMAQAEKFTLYVNGTRQGQFFDYSKQAQTGYFAYYGWQDSGQTTCTFENSWVWLLK